ncbi:MAG: hypothetical protein ACFFCW_46725 [Candidatus Hodarchaeota archaeon]
MTIVFTNPQNYPQSDDFISIMGTESVERIRKCGWDIQRSVFFETPYCAMTGAGAGIVRDYEHNVYYKVFHSTEGVVGGLTDSELRIVVEHERNEVVLAEKDANSNLVRRGLTSLIEEEKRHRVEFQTIEERYGITIVKQTIKKISEIVGGRPCIPRYVLLFWFCFHLVDHFNKFKDRAFIMSETMLSKDQRNSFLQVLTRIQKDYGSSTPMKQYMRLYINTIQDTNKGSSIENLEI